MKMFLIILGCVVFVFVAVVVGGGYWLVSRISRGIAASEAVVTAPANYQPAANDLAMLCQSDPKWFPDDEPLRPAWAPASVLKMGCRWVHVSPEGASVEFGGGFHHFGYELKRDAAQSTPTTNVWVLDFYSEDKAGKTLTTLSLPADRKLSKQTVIQNAMAEYRSRIGKSANDNGGSDVSARIAWLLRLDEPGLAVASIREFAAKVPRDWQDAMLEYEIDAGYDPQAGVWLERWAAGLNDFSAWVFAAEAYARAGEMDAAERCVGRATALSPDDPPWVQTHARHRAAPICRMLYAAGRYATCERLCDPLLKYTEAGQNLAPELTRIRDAARAARAGGTPAPAASLQIPDEFDPFKGIDLNALRTAASTTTRPADAPP